MTSTGVPNTGYQQPAGYEMQQGYHQQQPGYQPSQSFPVSPPYTTNVPATEIHHHGNEYNQLVDEGEKKKRADKDDQDDDDIPGKGPGGVPPKYFALDFENCFTEHEDTKIFPPLYKVLGLVFKYTKLVIYHIFVILVGIPLTIVWAITNGITAFVLIWMWGPALRYTIVWIYAVTPAMTTPMRALLAPLADVLGRVFRQIRIHADVNGTLGKKLAGEEHSA